MANTKVKAERRERIKQGIRKRVRGTTERPRLTIYRSNAEIYAQIIDDTTGRTLVSCSSREKDVISQPVPKTDKSVAVGNALAQRAVAAGISAVVFDRNGYKYHGRVKALADAARQSGLQF